MEVVEALVEAEGVAVGSVTAGAVEEDLEVVEASVEAGVAIEAAAAVGAVARTMNKLEVPCEAPKAGLEAVLEVAMVIKVSEALEAKVTEEEVKDTNRINLFL